MSEPDYSFQQEVGRLLEADQLEEALQFAEEQESKRPNDFLVFAAKAIILGRLRRYDEAIRAADESLKINPNDHETHSNKGVSLYFLERYEEAIQSFDACLSLRPHYPIAVQEKIFALATLGRYSDAVRVYEMSDLPDFEEAVWLNTLGYVYLGTDDHLRARTFLLRAKKANSLLSQVHFNLAKVHRMLENPFRSFFHQVFFYCLSALEQFEIWKKVNYFFRNSPHITESKRFSGSGTVFTSDSQQRETRSILKLLRDMHATALCNDTWLWFAVNIPYSAAEQNGVYGDIDIILKRPRYFMNHDAGFTYRGFQVKTVVVDKEGRIKSAKRGASNLRKIKTQLDVLKKFGCEQIFLLELHVLERGYSLRKTFPSAEIAAEIRKKAVFLQRFGYGYVVMAEEPNSQTDEESGGIWHPPLNVLPAQTREIGPVFQKLVDSIDEFHADPTTQEMSQRHMNSNAKAEGFGLKTGYCQRCRRLTKLVPRGHASHLCGWCRLPAY
ncbi:MAG: tetratricopeptide repeat protein [bacterium]|nr:tetratricopeptide repeat protein [bacterium]